MLLGSASVAYSKDAPKAEEPTRLEVLQENSKTVLNQVNEIGHKIDDLNTVKRNLELTAARLQGAIQERQTIETEKKK